MNDGCIHRRRILATFTTHAFNELLQMPQAERADSARFDEALLLCIAHGLPALTALGSPTNRTVDEIEIEVVETTFSQGLADGRESSGIGSVEFEFGGVEDSRARQVVLCKKIPDGTPDLSFVFVPLCRVLQTRQIQLSAVLRCCMDQTYDMTVSNLNACARIS